jgi:hypothetical protein
MRLFLFLLIGSLAPILRCEPGRLGVTAQRSSLEQIRTIDTATRLTEDGFQQRSWSIRTIEAAPSPMEDDFRTIESHILDTWLGRTLILLRKDAHRRPRLQNASFVLLGDLSQLTDCVAKNAEYRAPDRSLTLILNAYRKCPHFLQELNRV